MVFKNYNGDKGWDTDCHGATFTGGDFWVNNGEVRDIIKGDNYQSVDRADATKGDVVVYTDGEGNVEDSRTITRTDSSEGTCVYGQGGLETDNYKSQIDETWESESGTTEKEYYRKTDPDKVVTNKEASTLVTATQTEYQEQQKKEEEKK